MAVPDKAMAVSFEDIAAAARILEGQVVRTPCLRSELLSELLGCAITLKFETFQQKRHERHQPVRAAQSLDQVEDHAWPKRLKPRLHGSEVERARKALDGVTQLSCNGGHVIALRNAAVEEQAVEARGTDERDVALLAEFALERLHRGFADLDTARGWRQHLEDLGVEAVLTSDWPLDRFGRGDISLQVPPGRWSEAEEILSGLDLEA